jgi:hypothetical protein
MPGAKAFLMAGNLRGPEYPVQTLRRRTPPRGLIVLYMASEVRSWKSHHIPKGEDPRRLGFARSRGPC